MTVKEAFTTLSNSFKACMKNPFFLLKRVSNDLENISEHIEGGGGGSDVEVIPAQDSGFLVGNIQVNGEDNYLFAPPQPTQPDVYTDVEHKVGIWYHDDIGEDVYERTIFLRKNNVNQYEMFNSRTFINSLPSNFGYIQITGFYALRSGWVDNMGIGTSTIISIDLEHNGIYVETNLTYTEIIATYRYTKETV